MAAKQEMELEEITQASASSSNVRSEPLERKRNDNEPDESVPLSRQEDVEKGSKKQAHLSFGDRCILAFEKTKIYSSFLFKVCLATLTSILLLIWDSVSDYLVSIKHFL